LAPHRAEPGRGAPQPPARFLGDERGSGYGVALLAGLATAVGARG
jgi:hypothetical protein